MTTASPLRFTASTAGNDYAVTRRADGVKVGEVRKTTEHYNLHPRPATYTVWHAIDAQGQLVTDGATSYPRARKFSTRTEAAAYLADLYATAERIMSERAAELDALPTDDALPVFDEPIGGLVLLTETSERTWEVTASATGIVLGRVWSLDSFDRSGFAACPQGEDTITTDLGVTIAYPTPRDAALAIGRRAEAEDEAGPDDDAVDVVDDLCADCSEPLDLADDGDTLLPCAVCAEATAREFVARYVREAIVNGPTVEEQIESATDDPQGLLAEVLDYAASEGLIAGAATEDDRLYEALTREALALAEDARARFTAANVAEGACVEFLPGRMPSCDGLRFVVTSAQLPDNLHDGRPYVWLVRADDVNRPASRQRTRSAYVSELRAVALVGA